MFILFVVPVYEFEGNGSNIAFLGMQYRLLQALTNLGYEPSDVVWSLNVTDDNGGAVAGGNSISGFSGAEIDRGDMLSLELQAPYESLTGMSFSFIWNTVNGQAVAEKLI